MILTTIFGTAGLCAGGTFGAFAGAFDGKPLDMQLFVAL